MVGSSFSKEYATLGDTGLLTRRRGRRGRKRAGDLGFPIVLDGEIVRGEVGYIMTLGICDHGVHLHARRAHAEYNVRGICGDRLLCEQECRAKHNADRVSFQEVNARLEW